MKILGRLWQWWKNLGAIKDEPQDESIYLARCGYETRLVDTVKIFDEMFEVETKLRDGQPDYCLDCLVKMSIQCAWCGGLIYPGDPITLYRASPSVLDETRPDYAVAYLDGEQLCYVGCLGLLCAESGADRAGFWVAPGKVKRVASPLELAVASREMVIVSDLSDQDEQPIIKHLKSED